MPSFSLPARRFGARNAWSATDLKLLRELAAAGIAPDSIAARLRRSPSAVKNKAGMHGISLRVRDELAAGCDAVPVLKIAGQRA